MPWAWLRTYVILLKVESGRCGFIADSVLKDLESFREHNCLALAAITAFVD